MTKRGRVLRLKSAAGAEPLAAALRELYSYVRCDLELPSHVAVRDVGDAARLSQLIATWARRNPEEKVRTYIDAEQSEAVRDFVNTDHGLLATLVAERVVSRTGADLTQQLGAAARERLQAMNHVAEAARGQRVTVAVFDDAPYRPATLYDQLEPPVLRSAEGFDELMTAVLRRVVRGSGTKPVHGERTVAALARAVRELFLNTEQWATSDVFGVKIPRSVRILRIEQLNFETSDTAPDPVVDRYMQSEIPRHRADRLRLIEVSVVDTGPGLPSRHLRRKFPAAYNDWPYQRTELSAGDEYHAVIDCLRLHGTASNESYRGVGLDAVMQLMTALGALLKLRTGRLDLYRDFTTKPFDRSSRAVKEPYLLDTATQSGLLTRHPPVQGTAVTAVFPVAYET